MFAALPRGISATLPDPAMAIRSAAPVKATADRARMGIGDLVQMEIAARVRTATGDPGWMATVARARTEIAVRSRVVTEAANQSRTAGQKRRAGRRQTSNQLTAIPSLAKPPRNRRWLCAFALVT